MSITLEYNNESIVLEPSDYSPEPEYINVGSAHTFNRDMNRVVMKWKHERGGVRKYVLMVWENTHQDNVEKLFQWRQTVTHKNPMKCYYPNGEEFYCVFMPETDDALKFTPKAMLDDNTVIYDGQIALLAIQKDY